MMEDLPNLPHPSLTTLSDSSKNLPTAKTSGNHSKLMRYINSTTKYNPFWIIMQTFYMKDVKCPCFKIIIVCPCLMLQNALPKISEINLASEIKLKKCC
jgi:hypothetical protein